MSRTLELYAIMYFACCHANSLYKVADISFKSVFLPCAEIQELINS